MQFRSKLNEMFAKSAREPAPLEVPELAAYHGGSSGSSGSETLLAVPEPLRRSTVSLVKEFFTHKLSLVARRWVEMLKIFIVSIAHRATIGNLLRFVKIPTPTHSFHAICEAVVSRKSYLPIIKLLYLMV